MAYTKTNWVDNETTITANKMNNIENGIETLENAIPGVKTTNTTSDSDTYSCSYVNNINSYSTDEKFTGGYWIDGKKLYQKTFTGYVSGSTAQIDISSLNVDTYFVNFKCTFMKTISGNMYPLPYFYGCDSSLRTNLEWNNNKIYVGASNGIYAGGTYYVTLNYTKTTD